MVTAQLTKGQNGPLPLTALSIAVEVAAAADLAALLVTDKGTVRPDAEFVFFDQLSGPGVRLQPGSDGRPGVLAVSLTAVPADITQIRAVVTLDAPNTTAIRMASPANRANRRFAGAA